jgi:hypothetical protein
MDQHTLAQIEARINRQNRVSQRQPIDPIETFLRQFRPHCGMPREYLLSLAALASLPPMYSQEHVADPIIRAKFFTPDSSWTWYATEASIDRDGSDSIVDVSFFGYVVGPFPELGYFSLRELASIRGPLGLPVERDLYWQPVPLSRVTVEQNR